MNVTAAMPVVNAPVNPTAAGFAAPDSANAAGDFGSTLQNMLSKQGQSAPPVSENAVPVQYGAVDAVTDTVPITSDVIITADAAAEIPTETDSTPLLRYTDTADAYASGVNHAEMTAAAVPTTAEETAPATPTAAEESKPTADKGRTKAPDTAPEKDDVTEITALYAAMSEAVASMMSEFSNRLDSLFDFADDGMAAPTDSITVPAARMADGDPQMTAQYDGITRPTQEQTTVYQPNAQLFGTEMPDKVKTQGAAPDMTADVKSAAQSDDGRQVMTAAAAKEGRVTEKPEDKGAVHIAYDAKPETAKANLSETPADTARHEAYGTNPAADGITAAAQTNGGKQPDATVTAAGTQTVAERGNKNVSVKYDGAAESYRPADTAETIPGKGTAYTNAAAKPDDRAMSDTAPAQSTDGVKIPDMYNITAAYAYERLDGEYPTARKSAAQGGIKLTDRVKAPAEDIPENIPATDSKQSVIDIVRTAETDGTTVRHENAQTPVKAQDNVQTKAESVRQNPTPAPQQSEDTADKNVGDTQTVYAEKTDSTAAKQAQTNVHKEPADRQAPDRIPAEETAEIKLPVQHVATKGSGRDGIKKHYVDDVEISYTDGKETQTAEVTAAAFEKPAFPVHKNRTFGRFEEKSDEAQQLSKSITGTKSDSDLSAAKKVTGGQNTQQSILGDSMQRQTAVGNTDTAQEKLPVHVTVTEVYEMIKEMSAKMNRNMFTVVLTPETLGKITVKLAHTAGKLSVEILTETQAAKRLFESKAQELAQNLKQNDVEVGSYKVETAQQQQQDPETYDGSSKNPYRQQQKQQTPDDKEEFERLFEEIAGMV